MTQKNECCTLCHDFRPGGYEICIDKNCSCHQSKSVEGDWEKEFATKYATEWAYGARGYLPALEYVRDLLSKARESERQRIAELADKIIASATDTQLLLDAIYSSLSAKQPK